MRACEGNKLFKLGLCGATFNCLPRFIDAGGDGFYATTGIKGGTAVKADNITGSASVTEWVECIKQSGTRLCHAIDFN